MDLIGKLVGYVDLIGKLVGWTIDSGKLGKYKVCVLLVGQNWIMIWYWEQIGRNGMDCNWMNQLRENKIFWLNSSV